VGLRNRKIPAMSLGYPRLAWRSAAASSRAALFSARRSAVGLCFSLVLVVVALRDRRSWRFLWRDLFMVSSSRGIRDFRLLGFPAALGAGWKFVFSPVNMGFLASWVSVAEQWRVSSAVDRRAARASCLSVGLAVDAPGFARGADFGYPAVMSKASRKARGKAGMLNNLRSWVKGQSGNPAGRPPAVRDLSDFELASDVITDRAVGLTLAGWIRLRRAEVFAERGRAAGALRVRTDRVPRLDRAVPAERVHGDALEPTAPILPDGFSFPAGTVVLTSQPAPASLLDSPARSPRASPLPRPRKGG
jgi:hypothetical protein